MRKTTIAIAAALLAIPGAVLAHDFWLQPRTFVAAAPGAIAVSMFVGHGENRDRWGVAADHIVQFNSIGPNGLVDQRPGLALGRAMYDAIVRLPRTGAYVLALQSTEATSELPSVRFNDYAVEEGIAPIIAQRQRTGAQRRNGRELYSRRAKALVQIGPVDAAAIARATRPINLRLEIVPERHPQALDAGGKMPVRVLFRGRPLGNALVKLTNLDADAVSVAKQRTDAAGRTVFRIPKAGKWQLNVIWAEVLKNHPRADFRTTFSSLAFATG